MHSDDQVLAYPLQPAGPLDPPAEWEQLRQTCPVAEVELPTGDRAKLLTRHGDVRDLLADPRFARPTSQDPGAARVAPEGTGGVAAEGGSSMAIAAKGEEHQRWRRTVGKWFTARRMAALRPGMAGIAEDLIADMVAGGAPADLKAALGFPLPVYVICDILGVPAADRDRFAHWSDTFLSVTRFSREEIQRAHAEFTDYMAAHVADKRADPGDDLLGALILDGGPEHGGLSDEEIRATGMSLLVAGHETTANMIGKMVSLLLADRDRWQRLVADPSLVRTAVEEALRFDANLGFGLRRYLSEDVQLGDDVLPGGSTVICSMPAANRDGEVFAGAEEMDLGRSPNPHLTFGAGPHSCLGQALARTELQVALEVLLRELPSLELAVPSAELERVEGLLVGGLREVPVRW
ncbi:cytochrome P450 [Saccharopolyspora sp. HNM0983]|uniref:Cytochrome P450 n=1 Tax=Saccharopolyspora montiporae TaxID=2781240 RepID=A0A929FZD1_9PSEU|nr:cytochrome P450 [Saccharopolyspora sp. HNM0983]MBE9373612.1 cytochrome P450 [Saccharopolyspora sp. HNM0983]